MGGGRGRERVVWCCELLESRVAVPRRDELIREIVAEMEES